MIVDIPFYYTTSPCNPPAFHYYAFPLHFVCCSCFYWQGVFQLALPGVPLGTESIVVVISRATTQKDITSPVTVRVCARTATPHQLHMPHRPLATDAHCCSLRFFLYSSHLFLFFSFLTYFLFCRSRDAEKRARKFKESERLFSSSSTTAPQPVLKLNEQVENEESHYHAQKRKRKKEKQQKNRYE